MKRIIIFIFLISCISGLYAQKNRSSLSNTKLNALYIARSKFDTLYIRSSIKAQMPLENYTLTIVSPSGKLIKFDFSGDTLKMSGDLSIDEGSEIFFNNVSFLERKRVYSLKSTI